MAQVKIVSLTRGRQHRQSRARKSFLAQVWRLEERLMLAGDVPIPASQLANHLVPLSTIFWNGEAQPLNQNPNEGGKANIPSPEAAGAAKTITLTNYAVDPIYPFLRTANNGQDPNATNTYTYYDPQDLHEKEFRLYVGYTDTSSGTKYLGLPSGATIKFQVPLVLWDGDNISLVTDGTYLTASGDAPGSKVFNYDNTASIAVAGAGEVVSGSTWVIESQNYPSGLSPLVMFYYAGESHTVPNDAPAQLAELTFRDPYLTNFINDSFQTYALLNYDLSYVNTLVAPAAMEASNVPIITGSVQSGDLKYWPPNQDFGWHGSKQQTDSFYKLTKDFVTNDSSGKAYLGSYFNGKGWPQYYNPDPTRYIIPSGANIFDNSPLDIHVGDPPVNVSNYDNNQWLLSSSGGGAITANANGGPIATPTTTKIPLNFTSQDQRDLFASSVASMKASGQTISVTVNNQADILGSFVSYDNSSKVLAYVIDNVPGAEGQDYSPETTLEVRPVDGRGSGARGDVHVENGKIVSIGILPEWGGSGYTAPPQLIFHDPTGKGFGAKYHADISGGTVTVKLAKGKTLPTTSASYQFSRTGSDYASTAITNLWYSWAKYYTDQFKTYTQQTTAATMVQQSINGGPLVLSNQIALDALPPKPLAVGMVVKNVANPSLIPAGTTILKIEGKTVYLSQIPTSYVATSQTYSFDKPAPLVIDPISAKYTSTYDLKFSADETPKAVRFAGSVYEAMAVQAVALPPAAYLPITMNVVDHVIKFYANLPSHDKDYGDILVGEVRDIVKSILRGVYDYYKEPDQSTWYPNPAQARGGKTFNVYNLDPYVWFVHSVQGLTGYGFSVDDDVANPSATGPTRGDNSNHAPSDLQIGFGGTEGTGALSNARPLGNQNEWFPSTRYGKLETTATIGVWQGPQAPEYEGYSYITLTGPDPVRTLNQIITPGPGQIGAYIFAPGYIVPGTTLIFFPQGVTGTTIILSQPALSTATSIPITINASQFDIPGVPLKNSNFATPVQAAPQYYTTAPKDNGVYWSFTGTAGIAANQSIYLKNNLAPLGTQAAFIQGLGALSQAVALEAGNVYAVSFLVAQRKLDNGTINKQTLQLKVGGNIVGNYQAKVTDGGNYVLYTSNAFTVPSDGTYTLYISGTNLNGGDNTALIDDVRITG